MVSGGNVATREAVRRCEYAGNVRPKGAGVVAGFASDWGGVVRVYRGFLEAGNMSKRGGVSGRIGYGDVDPRESKFERRRRCRREIDRAWVSREAKARNVEQKRMRRESRKEKGSGDE